MRLILLLLVLLSNIPSEKSQNLYRKALFLGNSYTYVNNLPALTAALANSAGDSLYFESNAPGGYTLGWQPTAHVTNTVSLDLISSKNWDFVILQNQSQIPSISVLRDSCMYPASTILHDSVKLNNPCTRVLFYLTWGRRFGGTQCFTPNYCSPDFADFDHMQDSLTASYKSVADSLNDWIAPVGEAWRLILNTTPMVLHSSDNSHPNIKGTYLGACVFYAAIFGKSSIGLYSPATIHPDTALILQQAADSVVFGYASYWNLWDDEPAASFIPTISGDTLFTENLSTTANEWRWDFGDGATSNAFEPVHTYENPGTYPVSLVAMNPCFTDTTVKEVTILPSTGEQICDLGSGIRIIGPDAQGNIRFKGYQEDGTLLLYDLTGRLASSTWVADGKTIIPTLPKQLYIYQLVNSSGTSLATGKFLISR
ncbi:PKD domain-containing protein [Bacteroidota bacterium]